MKKILLVLGFLFLISPHSAQAQNNSRNPCFYPTPTSTNCTPTSSTTPLPVTATTTLAGFHQESVLTPITATTGGVNSSAFTAGKIVVVTNAGTTNIAYCQLGVAATTSSQPIAPSGGWFAFTSISETQITCATSTSTTTVNFSVGTGLPTGTGGGGGSGGGGSVTQGTDPWLVAGKGTAGTPSGGVLSVQGVASGASMPVSAAASSYAAGALAAGVFATGAGVDGWDLTQGAKADTICSTATASCTIVALLKFLNTSVTSPPPLNVNTVSTAWTGLTPGVAQTVTIIAANTDQTSLGGIAYGAMANFGTSPGAVKAPNANASVFYGTTAAVGDPCQTNAATHTAISITTNTTTRIIAPASAKRTYICYLFLTSAAADNVGIVEGTGGTCGSGTAGIVGGTTAANGPNFAANGGAAFGNGASVVLATAGTNVDTCLITSAATPLAGTVKWVQAP